MGEFAQEKINSLINFLTGKTTQDVNEWDKNWDEDKAKWMIAKIGEPLICRQLWTLYDKKYADISQIHQIQKEITDLEERKNQLEKKKKKLEEQKNSMI